MKLEHQRNNVEKHGSIEQGDAFGIEESAEAFDILFDGLYSNKTRAVCREILCNALDESWRQVPDVHMPEDRDPTFRVRDYGDGLDHQDVMVMYTTVFRSTKKKDNGRIGGFGLGSKAPFAYCDGFTVTSIHTEDGTTMKRVYSMYRDEDGKPRPALLSENTTEEHTGLEVAVPVLSGDFNAFTSGVEYVLRHLPENLRPRVDGHCEPAYPKYERNWGRFAMRSMDGGSRFNSVPSYVVLGNIEYPLTLNDDFATYAAESGASFEAMQALHRCGVTLFFDIGDISLAPSREALSYNKRTVAAISVLLTDLIEELTKEVQEAVDAADQNKWDRAIAYSQFMDKNSAHEIVNRPGSAFYEHVELIHGKSLNTPCEKIYTTYTRGGNMTTKKDRVFKVGTRNYRSETIHWVWLDGWMEGISSDDKARRKCENRVRKFLRQANADKSEHTHAIALMFTGPRSSAEAALTSLGLPTSRLTTASELPIKKVIRGTNVARKKADLRDYLDVLQPGGGSSRTFWGIYGHDPDDEEDVFDFAAGGFYVLTMRGKCMDGENLEHPGDLLKVKRMLNFEEEVVGVRTTKHKKFLKAPQWVNFFDHAKALVADMITPEYLAKRTSAIQGDTATGELFDYMVEHHTACDVPTLVDLYKQERDKGAAEPAVDDRNLVALARMTGQQLPSRNDESDGITWDTLTAKFSMLNHISNYYVDQNAQQIIDYIRLVEKS